jgi:geranylgeranyl diphosphate synthase type II
MGGTAHAAPEILELPPISHFLDSHTLFYYYTCMSFCAASKENFNKSYDSYKRKVEKRLNALASAREPGIVYDPIRYALATGGKRFRAVLVLLACEAAGGKIDQAIHAAAAMEVLHNFTLVHDDVMDNANLRRGKPTVHAKWDANIAILSGDEMIAQAYKMILCTSTPRMKDILNVYTDALIQVCEGQGFDKEFERRHAVTLDEYYRMISKKTGVVIAAAVEIGAIIGSGTKRTVGALRIYGRYLGRSFQIMDDYLDIMGTKKEFGKKIGGDIYEGKKTYLLLKGLHAANGDDRKILRSVVPGNRLTARDVEHIKHIYMRTGAVSAAKEEIHRCTKKANGALKPIRHGSSRDLLMWLADQLGNRTS